MARGHQPDLPADPGVGQGGRIAGFDPVPDLPQQPPGLVDGVRAVGMDRISGGVPVQHPDAQRPGIGAEFAHIGSARRGRDDGVTHAGTAYRVEHRRGVPDRAADAQSDAGTGLIAGRPGADPALRRLQADHSAACCGYPDRARSVGGVRDGNHAQGHRGGRSAAGSAWRVGSVPRIAGRPPCFRFRSHLAGELGSVRPACNHQARRAEPGHQGGIGEGRPRRLLQPPVTAGLRLPGIGRHPVLEQERHAPEYPVRQRAGGSMPGVVEPPHHHRIDRGVERLDPLDRRLQQLQRRRLT